MKKPRNYSPFALGVLLLVIAAVSTVAQAQTFSVLYNFGANSGDPLAPDLPGIVAQGRDGNLYSTTISGGATNGGAVFKITPAGTLTVLYSFDGTHGFFPYGGLTLGTDGNFYGTTYAGGTSYSGGSNGWGTVFKVTASGRLTVLYNFTDGSDGAWPYAPPIQGKDGNFYGTTTLGGTQGNNGTIYKISPSGTFTPIYQFDYTHGSDAFAPLVQGIDGNFYGTTGFGGSNGNGIVFKITTAGEMTVLYNFDGTHGANPYGSLVQGSDGNFYGTTRAGGTGYGVVFKITPTGALTVLHNIDGNTDGDTPLVGLVQGTDGNLYGVNSGIQLDTLGNIFKVSLKGSYSVLYNFDGTTGSNPKATPFQHTNGTIYGDTNRGGTGSQGCGGCGVFYSLTGNLRAFVSLLPYSGKVGKTIEFLGQGFASSTTVSFNGTLARPTVKSGTYLAAAVPNGATTGFVRVTTSSGTLTSNKKFRVTPQIKSFGPTSGPVGTVVTITGVSLTQTYEVTFGGVKATTFTVNSDTQVTATVPTGAKTGKISITTAGGAATSATSFTVTL
jgi:uncharacterized repeat protein (TIGR03803 family)